MAKLQSFGKFGEVALTKTDQIKFVGFVLALLWGIELVDVLMRTFTPLTLDGLGIRPRSLGGLLGIPLAPLLHGGFGHLLSNTVPIAVLSVMVLLVGDFRQYFHAVALSALTAGVGSWIFGAPRTVHIGASGVVFGLVGYVIARGIASRQAKWIVLAVIVAIIYGGLLPTLLQFEAGVSWTGHAFGFVGGIWAGMLQGERPSRSSSAL